MCRSYDHVPTCSLKIAHGVKVQTAADMVHDQRLLWRTVTILGGLVQLA